MHTYLPVQAAPTQTSDIDAVSAARTDTQQAGEEAARAVARMRHMAIDNWEQVGHFTQAALAENGLSYRDQELHSGVGASTVYRMALGNSVGVRAVQQFAAFATYSARTEETKAFWAGTLSRLHPTETSASADPTAEEIAALYAQLVRSESRKSVMNLLHALQESEAAG